MTSELDFLKVGIVAAFESVIRPPEHWSDSKKTESMTARVRRDHGGAGIPANSESITTAVEAFRSSGTIDSFRDLKYVCLGVCLFNDKGWSVLGEPQLRTVVYSLVEGQIDLRRRLRCFQALLSSYWTFRVNDDRTTAESKQGWRELRAWLSSERNKFPKRGAPTLPWLSALARHAELLSDEPCKKFGDALLRDDSSEFDDAIKSLAIPEGSWVFEETVIAQIRAAALLADHEFKAGLDRLLALAMGTDGVRFGVSLRVRCIAQLVSRFAKCGDRREHVGLRTAAVSTIGNPWLRREKWDASVVDSRGRPDEQAREMVNSWLKRRLIADFFTLLSVDGTGDPRRLDYWLQFEPLIHDMWFALGTKARARRSPDFREFRESALGRLLVLTDTTADNNAFVMRIGDYLAVEFGATGNAFFLFEWNSLGESLVNTLSTARALAEVSIHELKAPNHVVWLTHQDRVSEPWEHKFEKRICPLLGRPPSDKPNARREERAAATPVERSAAGKRRPDAIRSIAGSGPTEIEWSYFVQSNRLSVKDSRNIGGPLWVLGEKLPQQLETQLRAWGFRSSFPKGWYKYV